MLPLCVILRPNVKSFHWDVCGLVCVDLKLINLNIFQHLPKQLRCGFQHMKESAAAAFRTEHHFPINSLTGYLTGISTLDREDSQLPAGAAVGVVSILAEWLQGNENIC